MSNLTQMLGLTTQNFCLGSRRIAIAVALIRGFARSSARTVGNFGSMLRAVPFMCSFRSASSTPYSHSAGHSADAGFVCRSATLEGAKQTIAIGPVASQIAIKMLERTVWLLQCQRRDPFEIHALSNFVQMISVFALVLRSPRVRPAWSQPASGLGRSWP